MSDETTIQSPRLKQLADDLAEGKDGVVDAFWQEVKSAGVPFIESVTITKEDEDGEETTELDDKQVWVTFLYEGDDDTENVALGAFFMYEHTKDDPKKSIIHQLEGTNIWYWTQKLDKEARFQYNITPNHPFTPAEEMADDEEKQEEHARQVLVSDPLNDNELELLLDAERPDDVVYVSVFAGSEAMPLKHIIKDDDVPEGTVTLHEFGSEILDNERKIWVYTPPNYDLDRVQGYPLLFLFDGLSCVTTMKTPTVLDNLIAEGSIAPMVCVMFDNVKDMRLKELGPNDDTPEMIEDELLPFVRDHYHIGDSAKEHVISGVSFGGLAAAWNAFKLPHIFGNVLSQSGSFWYFSGFQKEGEQTPDALEHGWLIREFATHDKLDLRFYLNVGRYENADYWQDGLSHRSLNRHMRDVLIAKGYPVHYEEYAGGHDYCWWQQTLADGLIALQAIG